MSASTDFTAVTEIPGDSASAEQLERLYTRYYWAGERVAGKDVLELGCGAGQGLGYLARNAHSVVGSDVSAPLLEVARRHYGDRVVLQRFGAEEIPFPDGSFDVVIMFEAVYYVPDAMRFFVEANRVLRKEGRLLLATANKDLFDFTPSPHSVAYYGVAELDEMLRRAGFRPEFFGDTPVDEISMRQRILRPVKRFATRSGLMPKSKRMKGLVKRFVFGGILPLPPEVMPGMKSGPPLRPIPGGAPDRRHKVIFVDALRLGAT